MNIHSNARTCPNSRATIVAHVKAKAWCSDQAFAMGVSTRTGFKWSRRYRDHGMEGLLDRSSRPHRIPNLTEPARAELVLKFRRCRLSALEIATKLRMPRFWRVASSGSVIGGRRFGRGFDAHCGAPPWAGRRARPRCDLGLHGANRSPALLVSCRARARTGLDILKTCT